MPATERSRPEGADQVCEPGALGVGGHVDGGEVGAGQTASTPTVIAGRVEPGGELVARRVPHRHLAGGDRAERGPEEERHEERGDREDRAERCAPR